MFNMKSKGVIFGLGIVGVFAAMEDHDEAAFSPAKESLSNADQTYSDSVSDRLSFDGMVPTDPVFNPQGVKTLQPVVEKKSMPKKAFVGTGLALFTLGGIFTGLAVGDAVQEMAKDLCEQTPDPLFITLGACCTLAALFFLSYVAIKHSGLGKQSGIPLAIFGALTVISGGVGVGFLATVENNSDSVSKMGIYISMGIGALFAVCFIITIAVITARKFNVTKTTAVFATIATLSLGAGGFLVGFNMQETLHDMYGSEDFGMGDTACGITASALAIGLLALYITVLGKEGWKNGWKNNALNIGALACFAGFTACTVLGINAIGSYAESIHDAGTAGDTTDNLSAFAGNPLFGFFGAAAVLLIVGVLFLILSKKKICSKN